MVKEYIIHIETKENDHWVLLAKIPLRANSEKEAIKQAKKLISFSSVYKQGKLMI